MASRTLFNQTREDIFVEWLAGALSARGCELSEGDKSTIKEKVKNVDSTWPFIPKGDTYITIHRTPFWKSGEKFSGYIAKKEDVEQIMNIFGGKIFGDNPKILVENCLNPELNEACFCQNLSVNSAGDGLSGLHKSGMGMSNVGNSNLIC